jgi:homocysteine S-methyltransferase
MIKAMRAEMQTLAPPRVALAVSVDRTEVQPAPERPLEQKSSFAKALASGTFAAVVEVIPPRGASPQGAIELAAMLKAAGVHAINVPDGPRARARMSALLTAILLEREAGVESILHYSCRDRNLVSIQSDLLGAHAAGLRNILCVTGEPLGSGDYPDATAVFDVDSIGLTNMVHRLNLGLDVGGNRIEQPTGFHIGVALNQSAIDLPRELRRFRHKVEAGAEFAITQPVFEVKQIETYLRQVEDCRIPILAGIIPLPSYRAAEFLGNEAQGASVPEEVLKRMRLATDRGRGPQEGLQLAREIVGQLRGLVQGVQVSLLSQDYTAAVELLSDLTD